MRPAESLRNPLAGGWIAVVVSSVGAPEDGEWQRFRGPNGSGLGKSPSLPVGWTAEDYDCKLRTFSPLFSLGGP